MEFALALAAAGALFIGFAADLWARFACTRLFCTLSCGGGASGDSGSFEAAGASKVSRVFPGEDVALVIELYNMKLLPVWLSLEMPLPPHLSFADALPEARPEGDPWDFLRGGLRLLPKEKSRRVLRLRADRRGVARPGPVRISAGDLLGLCSRTRSFRGACEIVIFPRRLRLKHLNVPFQEYFGMHAARGPVEDPAWYAGTRDYTGTRPAKTIHWKASARLGILQEKLYEPTLQRKLLFILDAGGWESGVPQSSGGQSGDGPSAMNQSGGGVNAGESAGGFERMIETIGTLAAALMETGASFGLVTNARLENARRNPRAGVLPVGRGPEHLGRFLEILARVTGTAEAGLEEALRAAAAEYSGFVYCASSAGERAARVRREISGRKKIFCVFGSTDTRGAQPWEGFTACAMEDICEAPE
jgi:hypothetical protein